MHLFSQKIKVAPHNQKKTVTQRIKPPSVATTLFMGKINKSIQMRANPIVVAAQSRMRELYAKEAQYRNEYKASKNSQKETFNNFLERKLKNNKSKNDGKSYGSALLSKKRKTRNKSTKRKKTNLQPLIYI
jgi:hypothetical protein